MTALKLRVTVTFGAFAALLRMTPVDAQTMASSAAQPRSFIRVGSLPAPARKYLLAFGPRLQAPGSERTVLSGTFSSSAGNGPIQVTWQVPGWIVVQLGTNPPLIYDDVVGLQNASGISTSDANILESLFDDSLQSFLYGFRNSLPTRLLGQGIHTDNGTAKTYQGPWYDAYMVVAPALSQPSHPRRNKVFYLDSVRGLLQSVAYTANSAKVSTQYSNWLTANGNAFPGTITRIENGTHVFQFTVTSYTVSPAANDGVFPGH